MAMVMVSTVVIDIMVIQDLMIVSIAGETQ
jgi:hypothetical protein